MTTLGDSAVGHKSIRRPPLGLLLLEGRAVLEWAALLTIANRPAQAEGAWKPFRPPARWPLALRARAAAREYRRA
jgi:hypothetical protein